MRGLVPDLASPHPLGTALPAIYQEDDFGQRFLRALDDVLAPVFSTIDNYDAYLDPRLAPDDFVTLLGRWVGAQLDDRWDSDRRRAVVASAVEAYRLRGTAASLAAQVEIHTGGTVEIIENGATGWSIDPGGELPGSPEPAMVVRITVADPRLVDVPRIDALVTDAKPAHVAHRIEVVPAGSGSRGRRAPSPPTAETDAPDAADRGDAAGDAPAAS